ncbi:MAG TPA: NAD-dependent epimerase/dehydratase family protein [Candidatus Hydrogenedentes bacterium]|nr:NAD-dependent epimerase/dehydratase family protein [Candidatus Hydrogenedentota bacterium]
MSGRALVTGAAGFVGRVLCAHLESNGWEVLRCDRVEMPGIITCDVTDSAQIDRLLDASGAFTHIFHLAAIAFLPAAEREPARAMDINCTGLIRLAEALRARGSAARFLFTGTAEVYGPPLSLPITETHPLNPANPYAISKAAADLYCAYLHKAYGMETLRMRPFNHSGPGQVEAFVLSNFARQIAEIEGERRAPLMRVGNLSAARDFLHVNDVVRAYELAALHGRAGEAYNVCSGESRVIREALNLLFEMGRKTIVIDEDPARMRPVDIPDIRGSHEKLTAHTGWTPQIPFEKILEDVLNYWRETLAAESHSAGSGLSSQSK